MPNQLWQCIKEVCRANHHFMMIGFESARDQSGVLEFVRFAFLKSDAERFDGLVNHAAHHCGDRR